MNYLSHGFQFLDRPWFLAGTAVPDWLSVVNRKIRARSKYASPYTDDERETMRELSQGILQHHHDDRWFHSSPAFTELNLQFTQAAIAVLDRDQGFRTGFLGHILVELLLDAELIRRNPQQLDDYYQTVQQIDTANVASLVSEITGKDASLLSVMIHRFCEERFLADYQTDAGLLMRINGVMRRVGLPQLPDDVLPMFAESRSIVADRADELLSPPAKT